MKLYDPQILTSDSLREEIGGVVRLSMLFELSFDINVKEILRFMIAIGREKKRM